jgi:hypothetical protein
MSYDILYDKQFVKLPDGNFIPMILAGSNNVIEARYNGRGVGRRARDWFSHDYVLKNSKSRYFGTEKLIMKNVQDCIDNCVERNANVKKDYETKIYTEEEVKNSFGYFESLAIGNQSTGKATAKKYYNFYKNGIKNALTIEELHKLGIHVKFTVYKGYNREFSIPIPEWSDYNIISNTQFFATLQKAEKYRKYCKVTKDGKDDGTVYITLTFNGPDTFVSDRLKPARRRKKREIVDYKRITVDSYFTLSNKKGYLYRYTRNGYKYSWSSPQKQWQTQEEAEKYRLSLVKKKRYEAASWKVEEIKNSFTFSIPVYA